LGPPSVTLYRPIRQHTPPWLYAFVRATPQPVELSQSLRRAVWGVNPDQPVEGPTPMLEVVAEQTASLRFVALLGCAFSLLGALLAFTGVYGVTSDASHRATREVGVRKALGATTASILGLFVRRAARLCAPAIAAGCLAGLGLIGLIASEIRLAPTSSTWTLPVVAAAFVGLVLTATLVSTWKTARIDPAVTMRPD
jgi:hypothetical protein